MTDKLNRLTTSGLTLKDVYRISKQYYKSEKGDDKKARYKLDVKNARVTARQNYEYNRENKVWEQTGRDVRIDFLVQTEPISYKKTDNIKIHKYPVTFLIHNISKGINSTFKWRTGSLKKPIFPKPGFDSKKVAELNIRNQVQLQFFYQSQFALKKHNLLFGRNWATRPPVKTNPKLIPFFDKHALFIFEKFLIRMLGEDGGVIVGKMINK